MHKVLITFFCAITTYIYAQSQDNKEAKRYGGEAIAWGYPTVIASKEQPEPVTMFLRRMEISTPDGRGVFTINAKVSNNTDFALQFIASAKDRCLLLVEPVPPIEAEKPKVAPLMLPMNIVTIKPHSSMDAEGSMDIGDRQIKDFKSIKVRVLQATDASIQIKVKPDGAADFSPDW